MRVLSSLCIILIIVFWCNVICLENRAIFIIAPILTLENVSHSTPTNKIFTGAAKENVTPLPEYDVFKDANFQNVKKGSSSGDSKAASSESQVPSLATVKDFFMYLFSKSQLENDCIIMALIYVERLVKETKGRLCIRYDNWRSM